MRILMTMFGWADAGGGTIVPRQIAHELAHRGHDVTVLYAALEPLPGQPSYTLRAHQDGGAAPKQNENRRADHFGYHFLEHGPSFMV